MKKLKGKNGITLIALVVTIIVLIILAAVSINLVLGENGIISKTRDSKTNYQIATNEEYIILDGIDEEIELATRNEQDVWYKIEGTTVYFNNEQKDENYKKVDYGYRIRKC